MNKIKEISKYILLFVIIIGAFLLLLFLTSLIPSEQIKENVKKSAETLLSESNRKKVYIHTKGFEIEFDNYSDALMINTAYSIDSKTPLYSAMINRKNYLPGITKTIEQDKPGELKSASKYKYHNEVEELNDVVNGNIEESFEYSRYWHGYLIILRPLLILFNISQIRIILFILYVLLAILLCYLLYKKLSWIISLIFLFGLIAVEYFYMCFSLQGTPIFFIMMIFSIYILLKHEGNRSFLKGFFIVGIMANFFDLLTCPILTYGFPLIIYFLLEQKNRDLTIKDTIIIYIKTGTMWFIGYALTWFIKWVLVDILYNRNLIETAIKQVLYRSVGTISYNYVSIISANCQYIIDIFLIMIYIVLFLNFIKINKTNSKDSNIKLMNLIFPHIIMVIIPFALYFILKNHSYNHEFFTYRNLLLGILGILIIISILLNKKSVYKNKV